MEEKNNTNFIASCQRMDNGKLSIHIPKDVAEFLQLEPRDKVEISIRQTGLKSTRKIPSVIFGRKR